MTPRPLIIAAALALAPLAALAAGKVVVVDQSRLQFSVAELRIKVGDKVRFTNSDRTTHNLLITFAGNSTNSGLQKPGQPFEAPFSREGVYQVECGIHPKMRMKVVTEK